MEQYGQLSFIMATNNAHKLSEVRGIIPFAIISSLIEEGINIDISETGLTFEENALIKARAVSSLSGKPALADDSGLKVSFLGGEPGVFSARYAGVHGDDRANNALLLERLKGVPAEFRAAKFVAAAACSYPGGREYVATGEVLGSIAFLERGEMGFGYDPLFIEKSTGKRFSEMPLEEKSSLSHRMKAFRALFEMMGIRFGR